MKKRLKNKLILFISLVLISTIACEQLDEDYNKSSFKNPIRIGVIANVSIGREIAENIFFAVKMAADEINQKGGLDIDGEKRKFELIFKDSEGNPKTGIKIVNELIEKKVDIIIGPTTSAVAVEMTQLCIDNNILMMTYSATIPEISILEDEDLIWRTCPSDAFSGRIMAQYSIDSLQNMNGAILYRNDNFGVSMANIIQERFESLGGSIVAKSYYPTNGVDISNYNYDDEINYLLEYEPQIIFLAIFEEEVSKITQDLWYSNFYQDYNTKPTLFLTEGAFPKELLSNGQPEVLETIIGISSSTTNTQNYSAYKSNYAEKYGFDPATYSEHAYDALYSIAYAIQKAQSVNPEDLKQKLRNVTKDTSPNHEDIIINVNEFDKAIVLINSGVEINYNGASGKIDFDENGDPNSTFVIWGLENDKYKEISYYNR
jgi:ABC-type branched-subunit amino acid transport system substrate-binding protein